jgi:hypothetical protein
MPGLDEIGIRFGLAHVVRRLVHFQPRDKGGGSSVGQGRLAEGCPWALITVTVLDEGRLVVLSRGCKSTNPGWKLHLRNTFLFEFMI